MIHHEIKNRYPEAFEKFNEYLMFHGVSPDRFWELNIWDQIGRFKRFFESEWFWHMYTQPVVSTETVNKHADQSWRFHIMSVGKHVFHEPGSFDNEWKCWSFGITRAFKKLNWDLRNG